MLNKYVNLNLKELEKKINYEFKNKEHLILALTHSSFVNEKKDKSLKSNERIEFLGVSVLNITMTQRLYSSFPKLLEGELTKLRAVLICEATLVKCARNIKLGKYLLFGVGEAKSGGRERTSVLSDAFEALIGAIFLDAGLESAKEFIFSQMDSMIEESSKDFSRLDYKTELQEVFHKKGHLQVKYELVTESGPDHEKFFVVNAIVNEEIIGRGEGKSKKEAEQMAAKKALVNYGK